jgi:Ca2+-binding RTX toxin-like protein
MGLSRMIRRLRNKQEEAASKRKRKTLLEPLEPRVLLSADFTAASAQAVQDGLDQLGIRLDDFLADTQNVLNDTKLPFVVQVEEGKTSAPTLGSLFSLQVDTNGAADGGIDPKLDELDRDLGGGVDAGEFIQGWLIGAIYQELGNYPNNDGTPDSTQFADWLKTLDTKRTFAQPTGQSVTVELKVNNATDLTEAVNPADMIFDIDFTLTADQNMPIDLGTEADALKLLSYSGNINTPPTIPVDAKLDFGFTFGVHTSGQTGADQTLNHDDFFVRTADTLNVSAESHVVNFGFNLNIGFLGATVSGGTIDFQAAVKTVLIDPDSPSVLGFTIDQYGVEQPSGVVTSLNAIPSADLIHSAGFVLRIGNAGIATEVKVTDDDSNGTDLANLVDDINGALGTAGLGSVVIASLDASNHLQFSLVETANNPFGSDGASGFGSENYSATGQLSAVPNSGDAIYPYEFGDNVRFLLSVDGAVAKLIDVRFHDPAQEEIGFGVNQIATLPDLIAENAPTAAVLTGDAGFVIGLRMNDGSIVSGIFNILATDTADNVDAEGNPDFNALAADINAELASPEVGSAVNTLIQAVFDGERIRFQAFSGLSVSVSAMVVATSGTALTEIGFAANQMTTLTITAPNAPISTFDVSEDAHFKLTISTTNGSLADVQVTVPADPNDDAAALAEDINSAIDTAITTLGDKVDVEVNPDGKIVLKAKDESVYALSIITVNTTIDDLKDDVNRALAKAGLNAAVTASIDGTNLILTAAGSKSLEITHTLTLDAGDTYQELVDTDTDELFKPDIDPASNISLELPVTVTAGLNYYPPNVAIVGNFNPFGQLLPDLIPPQVSPPKPVATIGTEDVRFKLAFTLDPSIDNQNTQVSVPDSSTLSEELRLVNMAEPLNFNLVTADSMVGLISGLGKALQQIADSGLFANYDIPFADASWSDLLNYSDANTTNFSGLIDRSLIYETGADGVYDPSEEGSIANDFDRLLKWVVDNKGTGETSDDVVYLVPNFITAQDLAALLSTLLGVPNDATGINANYNPAASADFPTDPTKGINELTYTVSLLSKDRTDVGVTAPVTAPFEYDVALSPFAKLTLKASAEDASKAVALQGYTGLSMTFGINLSPPGTVIYDTSTLADLNGGAGVDIKTEYAVTGSKDVIYAARLSADAHLIISIDNTIESGSYFVLIVPASETSTNYRITDLVHDINVAIGLNSDLNGKVRADSYGQRLTLSRIGEGTIQVGVLNLLGYDPAYSELGFAALSPKASLVTAERSIPMGRLSSDARFDISVDGNTYQVTVPFVDTQDCTLLSFSNKIDTFSVGDTITGGTSGATAKILDVIYPDPSNLSSGSLALVNVQRVFQNGVEDVLQNGEELKIGGATVARAVGMPMSLTGNTSIADLVADVNKALATVKIGVDGSGNDVFLSSLIKADYDNSPSRGSRLILTALDSTTQFSVRAYETAYSEMGLPADATANQADFVIYDSSGNNYPITLDPTGLDRDDPEYDPLNGLPIEPTVRDLIDLINAQIGSDNVVADFNATHTGLQLYDKHGDDTNAADAQFRVETINGSTAILMLGLFGAGNTGTQGQTGTGNRYLIEGGQIGLTHLDDRFFVRNAELWGAVGLQTPAAPDDNTLPGILGSGLFGIVGVDTNLQGSMYAQITANIMDPDTGTVGDTATLLDLYNATKQGRLTEDAKFTVTIHEAVDVSADVTVAKADTDKNNSLDDLVADVNKALADKGLATKIMAQAAGTRIEFVSLGKDVLYTPADESVPFTITAGVGAAGLGLSGTLNSIKVKDTQTIDGNAAPRYAIDDPVVSKVDELAFLAGGLGAFTPGAMVYGWADTDNDENHIIDTVTGSALVLGTEGNSLIVTQVSGTFAGTAVVMDINDLSKLISATVILPSAGTEATTKANFGHFTLGVDVQQTTDKGFGAELVGVGKLFSGQHYDVGFGITDFGNPYDPKAPVATFDHLKTDTGSTTGLYALKDLGYDDIASALQQLLVVVNDVNSGFTDLNTPLPAINRSINDLLSLVSGFERGTANAGTDLANAILALSPDGTDIPALTLQNIPRALRSAFGLPSGPDTVTPDPNNHNWIKLDFDSTNNMLLMDVSLEQTISTKLGLDIPLLDENGDPIKDANNNPLFLTSGGVLKVGGKLDVNLNVGINLNPPADPDKPHNDVFLFDTSNISATLHVEGEGQEYESGGVLHDGMGLVFRASIGPLAVFIQDGEVTIDAAFSLPGLDFGYDIHKKLINDPLPAKNVQFTDWKPAEKSSSVDVDLPMFYGGEGPNNYVDDFTASGPIGNVSVHTPDFTLIAADITSGDIQYDPFDNILLAFDTLNVYLESLSDMVAGDILGINLPFVGDQLADLLFIETFRNELYTTLKNGVENDIDPTPEEVTQMLIDLFGPGENAPFKNYLQGTVGYLENIDPNQDGIIDNTDISTWFRQWSFELYKDKSYTLDNFDIGISNLDFDLDAPVKVDFAYDFSVTFGVNFTQGAYIDVSDGKELNVHLDISLDGSSWAGTFGFLKVNATELGKTGADINFDVDVQNENGGAPLLGFSDLGNMKPVATILGNPLANAADVNSDSVNDAVTLHLVTTAIKGLPSLSTDLVIDWSLKSTEPLDPPNTPVLVSSLSGDGVTSGVTLILLNNMSLDAKSVAKSLLGPVFDTIEEIIEPFMPVVDTLTYPIPILSDVAGKPFTLLDLAAIFGSVDPSFIDAVKDILNVIKTIGNIIELPVLPLGNLTLYDGPGGAIQNLRPNDPNFKLSKILVDAWDPSSPNTATTGWDFNKDAFDDKINGNQFLKDLRDGKLAKGLSMPIFTDPRQGVKLLLDQNATMIDYLIPPLSVDFSYLQVFPIFGPLSLSIEIGFGFELDLHSVGFDTWGYQRYANGGFRDASVIFDGFYLNDLNTEGVDAPEITFEFSLVGAAELNVGFARAGVGGGIDAKILFDWNDPVPDGHVHISEMLGNLWANDYDPLAIFDVSGALTFQMFAFIEIMFIPRIEIPITPETTLFSFDIPFDRPPILATQAGDTLILNMGPNSKDRLRGDTSDGNEDIELTASGGTVYVTSEGFGVDDAQEFSGIKHIVGIGGQGDDRIIMDLTGSTIDYELEGGAGDDDIEVKGGAGGTIHGGVGNDTLKGGAGVDKIWGEEGNDTIYGGGGADILFGDFGRVFEQIATADPLVTSRITDADGVDQIHGDGLENDGVDGDDIIIGGGGNDRLWGDGGDDVIIGDGGRFGFEGAFDTTNLLPASYNNYTRPGIDTYVEPKIISENIDAIYEDLIATFNATDLGFGGNDTISGGEGGDVIIGGTGDDTVNGDAGTDIILGGKGFDDIHGGGDGDYIFGNDQADTIYGDDGADVISGGTGNDYIHGNTGDDVMKGDSGADVMFGDEDNDLVMGQTEPDILFGGAGNDLVIGGTGNDIMFGDDGVVAKLSHSDGTGYRVIYNDLLLTAAQKDNVIVGVTGASGTEGNFADDDARSMDLTLTYVTPNDGNDFLSGNAGEDYMFGGGGNDTMGGDVDPRLPSAGSNTPISQDVMIGDGGMITFDKRQFRSVSTLVADQTDWPDGTYTFDDVIYGDNGNDYIFGGEGNDFLFGGHGKVVTTGVVGAFRDATDGNASDNDIIVADNGRMEFASATFGGDDTQFGDLKRIYTTDTSNDTGGHDYAEGELGNDVIFGGVNGTGSDHDVLIGNASQDVILGDNGELDFGDDSGDTSIPQDTDLTTLDLIRSYRDGLGGTDEISGDQANDVLIGGTGGDIMYGDNATASSGETDGEDIMLGDNGDIFLIGPTGRLTVQIAAMTVGTAVDLITTTDAIDVAHPLKPDAEKCGGPDTMSGNAKADIILGGVNNDDGLLLSEIDRLYGDRELPTDTTIANDGDDIMLGDNGLLDFTYDDDPLTPENDTDRNTLDFIHSEQDGLGGIDTISGNKGQDLAIGGTAGDTIYGDDVNESAYISAVSQDGADMLLGDNADVFLVAKGAAAGGDLKVVLDAAVKTIRTTDDTPINLLPTGGSDTISGNAKGDVIAGGVFGDTLYGDQASPDAAKYADDGNDSILGDNGAFEWLSDGGFNDISGIDIAANNPDLWAKYGTGTPDTDLTTLDLVTTEQPNSGGRDLIYGDQGKDFVFGGTDADTIYGDDGNETGATSNNDLLFGDHGRIYPQFPRFRQLDGTFLAANYPSRNFFTIDSGNGAGGEGDRMWGEEGDDTMLGNQGDDRMFGGSGNDDMTGGHNVAGGYDELTAPAIAASLDGIGIAVPAIDDVNDLMDGGTGNDSMAGDNAIIWRRGDDLSPRFRELTEDTIYTTTADSITANIGGDWQSDPDDAIGRDIELIDHSDTTAQGLYGADIMAGGADSDVMFGELANDLMQGDGLIGTAADSGPNTETIVVADSVGTTGGTLYFNIPEDTTDADDYMEGNGGSDLMYGGLGQDDIIGGSSELFGLTTEVMRPDDSDFIFGGVGIDTDRNDIGDTETEALASENDDTHVITTVPGGHARDADFIMGDNANVFRLVNGGASGTNPTDLADVFRTFNYDNYGSLKIIPRAMQQLDYRLGGADYNGGTYVDGAAQLTGLPADNGAADLIHGESGDDIIFGMTGSDVIFGEGQDDDILGGYGHDWISGGTGQDGVLGDDGLIYTSRNGTDGEPLNGIDGLLASDKYTKYSNGDALDELITTPGSIQSAVINVSGELKKTIELVPFSFDPGWEDMASDDEFPDTMGASPYADDIIFGGLGSDWLHGGSGDDAISGAEALPDAFVPDYSDLDGDGNTGELINLGYTNAGNPANLNLMNPGDVLAFNKEDTDGRHLNNRFRAGEFFLYDEYSPLHKILLNGDGSLWDPDMQTAPGNEFILNFDESEGVYREGGWTPGNQNQSFYYPPVNDDGKDAIFGDLGNDWLVGGTGRDNMYGGWGNDLLNADDDQTTNLTLNDMPDTHPTYEDRAYGGAGRDVLIGNTGGDRLIDWVGEYNSYLVPYAPFGEASVSRTLQPFLPEFLYALSAGDGADPTQFRDGLGGDPPLPTTNNPIPSRNGEPWGELGLVLQKDFAWQDQTGAPADPQAGNIPGGKRDVLRTANFNDNTTQGFFVDSGSFTVSGGALKVAAASLGKDAAAVFYVDQYLPSYYEVLSSLSVTKPTAGWKANAYIIFDYYSSTDFKFAGLDISTNKFVMGHKDATGWIVDASRPAQLKPATYYNLLLAVNGTNATLMLDNASLFSYTFAPRIVDGLAVNLNTGMVGVGSDNSRGVYNSVTVQRLAPQATFTSTEDFSDKLADLFVPQAGTWKVASGRYSASLVPGFDGAMSLLDLSSVLGMAPESFSLRAGSYLELKTGVKTDETSMAGLIYDYYGPEDFKFVAIKANTDQVIIGHHTKKGWVYDNVFSKTIDAGVNYNLTISFKGTTVSVLVGTQAAGGFTYNAMLADGAFGLFTAQGAASFDNVTVKTDDPAFPAQSLTAAAAPAVQAEAASWLTYAQLDDIIAEAKDRWAASLGSNIIGQAALDHVTFQLVNFGDLTLGKAIGASVLIDLDAAGWGWFVDATPFNDVEFGLSLSDVEKTALETSPAFGRMDLLTVVMHEMGHVLGFEDLDPNAGVLMSETLDAGTRRLNDSSAETPNLVVMDSVPVGELASMLWGAKDNKASWLEDFLVGLAGTNNNPFDPTGKIKISIPGVNGGSRKKL